jgi:hypothetical protein
MGGSRGGHRSVLETLDVAIKHGFGFGDWRKLEQMGQALFLHEFQIDAFGQCSFPEKERIGMDRLICPNDQEQGTDPGEGDPGYVWKPPISERFFHVFWTSLHDVYSALV